MKAATFRTQRPWNIMAVIGFGLLSAQIVASAAHGRSGVAPSPKASLTELREGSGVERNAESSARDAWNASREQTALDFISEDQSLVPELPGDPYGDLDHDSDVPSDWRLALAPRCCILPGGGCVAGSCPAGSTPVACPCDIY